MDAKASWDGNKLVSVATTDHGDVTTIRELLADGTVSVVRKHGSATLTQILTKGTKPAA